MTESKAGQLASVEASLDEAAEQAKPRGRARRLWVFAASLSLFVHLVGVLIAAVLILAPPGQAQRSNSAVPAVIDSVELTTTVRSELSADTPEIDTNQLDQLISEAQSTLPDAAPAPSLTMSDLGSEGTGLSEGFEAGETAAGGSASFFGVAAQGTRFAYVLDVSGSMDESRLRKLNQAFARSVNGMAAINYFSVVLFDSSAAPMTNGWVSAEAGQKRSVTREVRTRSEDFGGGTAPLSAFEIVLGLNPRPDAIFFMTDGAFGEADANQINQLNAAGDVSSVIHCITLGSDEGETLMQRIARASGGTYRHVP